MAIPIDSGPSVARVAACAALVLPGVALPGAGTALAEPADPTITCTEEGNFPHPNDFTKFYRCNEGGESAVFHCPPGTVYDTDLPPGHCNYPWAGETRDRGRPDSAAGAAP
ncbi:chitin binding peritrophin-A domain-containing protein [Streptomyces sp. NPDC086554]|uniref:chitin binding peritrophin-A domain-containing protein n=1 Tax=Streptomyces sp. NPDC086554 TaxID=3154864 RepID=UPI0034498426